MLRIMLLPKRKDRRHRVLQRLMKLAAKESKPYQLQVMNHTAGRYRLPMVVIKFPLNAKPVLAPDSMLFVVEAIQHPEKWQLRMTEVRHATRKWHTIASHNKSYGVFVGLGKMLMEVMPVDDIRKGTYDVKVSINDRKCLALEWEIEKER